ncbi:MAG: hypothetical protein ACYCWE_12875 [Eubacteriales bacterium]
MFKFIKQFTVSKNENARSFRRDMAKQLNGRKLKYVTERIGDEDYVIGKEGSLIRKDNELLVLSCDNIVFRAKIDMLQMNELLSYDGIILTGEDLAHEGKKRCVIAYYTYYRKVD